MTHRILTAQFETEAYGPSDTGPYDVTAEVTGSVGLRDDTYEIRIQSIRIGETVYAPAMVSARVASAAEDALVWRFEALEAAARRSASVAAEVKALVAPFTAGRQS